MFMFDALLSTVTNNECFNVALKEFLTKERENFLAVRTIIAKKSIYSSRDADRFKPMKDE